MVVMKTHTSNTSSLNSMQSTTRHLERWCVPGFHVFPWLRSRQDEWLDSDNRIHPPPLTLPPAHVLEGHKRKVDLQALVTAVVASPWASPGTFDEANQLIRENGYTLPVKPSALSRYRALLPRDERIDL